MTDESWLTGVKEGKIKNANSFKPARGKLANGGQMDIVVEIDSQTYPAVFLAKRGPEEFDVSQLAAYQVDRMLGVCQFKVNFLPSQFLCFTVVQK